MNMIWVLLLLFTGDVWADGSSGNVSSRPVLVNVGAIFSFDSTIGRVAKIAIEEAVKDVNSNSTLLPGTKLVVQMQNSNCSGFLGMVGALQFMETDVVAILGPQSSVVAHSISIVANELQVPILSFAATDPTLSPLQFPYFIRTTQNDLYQMQAAADIVDYYGWTEVIVIFIDDDYGRNGISALGDALAARRCKITYKAGIPPVSTVSKSEIMDILVKLAFLESRVIVLHVNPNLGFTVFSVAQYLGMMGNGYAWIATDWLSSVLDSSSPLPSETVDTLQGVLVLRPHSPDSDRKKAFLSKWHKRNGEPFSLNSYAFYAYDAVWLVAHAIDSFFKEGGVISFSVDPNINSSRSNLHLDAMTLFDEGPRLLKNILQTSFMGLSGPIKFSPDRDLILPAYDVINVIGTGLRGIGYWSNYSGLSTVPPETLYLKPPNRSTENQHLYSVVWPGETVKVPRGWVFPNGAKKMKIGVPIRVSFKEFVSQQKDTDTYEGLCIDVFTAAVSLLPYAVPYQFVPYGNGKENPSYNDLVKMITTGVFDAAIGDIAIVANRTKMVDFTQPYVSSGLVVVAPFKKLNTGVWAFLRPFTPSMWGVAAIFFVIMGIVVWILEHRINDEFRGTPRTQIVTVLWFSMSTLFFSHRENTVSALGRTLLLLWLFVVLIINSSYTANLTSILTVQQLYSPIKGIESLKRGDEPIGFQVGSFAEHYLSEEIGIAKSRLVPLGSPEEYASALKLGPKNGGVAAVVDERPYVELFLSDQCKFRIVGQEVKRDGWGFAFQRDSPLAVDMSGAILELSENGELQRIHDKWLQSISCDSTDLESNRLHLSSFWGLYLIFGTCCFLAIFIYFCHLIRKYYRTRKDEQIHNGEGGGSFRSGRLQTLVSLFDEKKDMKKGESKRRRLSSETSQGSDLGDNSRSGHDETDIVVSST